ncbi:MAG: hypothetical protein DME09_02710 [Candidatus Rokuibacteriota bacterium]|nr:MAG: hypothetical protein DME09_02710 [Candidatus Rokubacteria bacterium]
MWIDPLIVATALVLYTALLFILLAWVSRTYSLVQPFLTRHGLVLDEPDDDEKEDEEHQSPHNL